MEHIYSTPRCALWMPMGGGKTVSTLTAYDRLNYAVEVWPAIVLAPKRVARSTWPDEIEKWEHLSHLRVSTILGSVSERQRALAVDADIYTMNYDNLPWLMQYLRDGRDWEFPTVIADEMTRLKGYRLRQGATRARALGKVAHTKVKRFTGLTGTPRPNGLQDLWGQAWFLDQGQRLGRTYSAFQQRWFTTSWDGYGLEPLPFAQGQIIGALKDVCLTIEVGQVDEPVFHNIFVDPPKKVRRLYDEMQRSFFIELSESVSVEAVNAAAKSTKLAQIANGAIYPESGNPEYEVLHDEKLDALESIIEESGGASILVSYTFVSDVERIKKRFPHAVVLDDDPATLRKWNAGKIRLLLAHPKSAGHGLNMAEGGNILVFFSLDWNLEEYMQIIERIGPQRQKQAGLDRPVYVYRILMSDSIDGLKLERLNTKKSAQAIILEAMKRSIVHGR